MAYIKINTNYPVYNGRPITFVAPCDCTEAEGITVGSTNFVFKDAHGATLTGIGNVFSEGALVKVILDVTGGSAYIQNGDNNSYQQTRFIIDTADIADGEPSNEPEGTIHFIYE